MTNAKNLIDIFLDRERIENFVESFNALHDEIQKINPELNEEDLRDFMALYFSHLMKIETHISEDEIWDFIDDIEFYAIRFEKIKSTHEDVMEAVKNIIRDCYPSVCGEMMDNIPSHDIETNDYASMLIALCEKMDIETTLMATYTRDKSHILFFYNGEV